RGAARAGRGRAPPAARRAGLTADRRGAQPGQRAVAAIPGADRPRAGGPDAPRRSDRGTRRGGRRQRARARDDPEPSRLGAPRARAAVGAVIAAAQRTTGTEGWWTWP